MNRLLLLLTLLLCGCSYNKRVAEIKHADGSGVTYIDTLHVGGWIRPGSTIVFVQTVGSNQPVVLNQASGPPVLGNVLGTATGAAAGFFAGYGIGKNNDDGGDTTTVIQGEPREGPIVPPTPTPTSSRPPFGPPPWHGKNPHNKGR